METLVRVVREFASNPTLQSALLFDRELLLEAFGRELCGLQPARIERSLRQLKQVDWAWRIKACALSESLKTAYLDLVMNRMERLE